LWECAAWTHQRMVSLCGILSVSRLRTKYLKWVPRYISYSKMRRKTNKKSNALKRACLGLIHKLADFLEQHRSALPEKDRKHPAVIKKVYSQQYALFHKGIKPKHRIISLHKDYL